MNFQEYTEAIFNLLRDHTDSQDFMSFTDKTIYFFRRISELENLWKKTPSDRETFHFQSIRYLEPLDIDNLLSEHQTFINPYVENRPSQRLGYTHEDSLNFKKQSNALLFKKIGDILKNSYSIDKYKEWINHLQLLTTPSTDEVIIDYLYYILINIFQEDQADYLYEYLKIRTNALAQLTPKLLFIPYDYWEKYPFGDHTLDSKKIEEYFNHITSFLEEVEHYINSGQVDTLQIQAVESPILDMSESTELTQIVSSESISQFIGGKILKTGNQTEIETVIAQCTRSGILIKEYKFPAIRILSILKNIFFFGIIKPIKRASYRYPLITGNIRRQQTEGMRINLFSFDVDYSRLKSLIELTKRHFFHVNTPAEEIISSNVLVVLNNYVPLIDLDKTLLVSLNPEVARIANVNWITSTLITCEIYFPADFQNRVRPLQDVYLILNEMPDLRSPRQKTKRNYVIHKTQVEDSGFIEIRLTGMSLKEPVIQFLLVYQNEKLAERTIKEQKSPIEEGVLLLFQTVNDKLGLNKSKTDLIKYIEYLDNNHNDDGVKKAAEAYYGSDQFTEFRSRRDAIREITVSLETLLSKHFTGRGLGKYCDEFVTHYITDSSFIIDWNCLYRTSYPLDTTLNSPVSFSDTIHFDDKWKQLINLEVALRPFKDRLLARAGNASNKLRQDVASFFITTLCRNLADHRSNRSNVYTYFRDYRTTIEGIVYTYFLILEQLV